MGEENVQLSDFTTFKIGGLARYFFRVKTIEEAREVFSFARQENLPFFILGGGSNLLVSDEGFPGVIIKNEILGISFVEEGDEFQVFAGAGENWDSFVDHCVDKGLYGLENLSGIPGTVGAAPVQNIGAYGSEAKDTIVSVEALDSKTGKLQIFTNEECRFGYRDSFFKTAEGKRYLIANVTFRLKKGGVLNIEYKDVKSYFEAKKSFPTLKTVREAVLAIRARKFPDLATTGTAGSFFKNPIISQIQFDALKKKYPDLPGFVLQTANCELPSVKVPLAWILDNVLGIKGYMVGRVGLYNAQPLVVVNSGGARATEVLALAKDVANKIKEKTGIEVVWEVEML